MSIATAAQIASETALLVVRDTDGPDLGALVRMIGFQPLQLESAEVINGLREEVSLCLVDLRQNGEAIRVVRAVRQQQPRAVIIGIADSGRASAAADAIRAGAFDVLPWPPAKGDVEALIANAREHSMLNRTQQPRQPVFLPFGVIGTSAAMRAVLDVAQRAAAGRCGILISGERGTGRETIARAIHASGANAEAPFVRVDCSGPAEELDVQLFGVVPKRSGNNGHARARNLDTIGQRCLIAEASGGILFLENVVDLPVRLQARLVRLLKDREAFVEGVREPIPLDVRPIASVDSAFGAALEDGRLQEDLYERLSLIRIDVPALRQRREDIPLLAAHFLKELCRANGKPIKTLSRPALTLLAALPWRGNATELKRLLERLILLVPSGLVRLEDVLAHTQFEGTLSPSGLDATLRQARAKFECDYISAVLQHHHGRIADAAKVLGIQRTNLYRKIRRLNLLRPRAVPREG